MAALLELHATILLDDGDPSLIYGPGWMDISEIADIGGTTAWAQNSKNTYVACSFQGTSISFTGNTEPSWSNLTALIDNGTPTNLSVLEDDPPQFYMAWYNSPILSDGNHIVNLTGLTLVALDYVTIEAGLNTPLSGSTLIVDDNDTTVVYTGGWIQSSQSYFLHDQILSIMPYLNTTHYSNTVGNTASFAFTGTSVSVYGVVSWTFIGSISISFLLDGKFESTYRLISNGTDPEGVFYDHNSFQFFNISSQAGSHVLEINVTEIEGNQIFILDYFLYQPSFSTLATMLNVTARPSASTLSFTRITSSHSQSPALSPAPTIPPSISPSISPTSYHAKSSPTIGALIGSVIDGVFGIVLLVLGIFLYKRFSQKSIDTETSVKPLACNMHNFHIEPYAPTQAQGIQSSHPIVASVQKPQYLGLNPLVAEMEALRSRLVELERTRLQEGNQFSSSPNDVDSIVQMRRIRIRQESTEPPPSYREGSGCREVGRVGDIVINGNGLSNVEFDIAENLVLMT